MRHDCRIPTPASRALASARAQGLFGLVGAHPPSPSRPTRKRNNAAAQPNTTGDGSASTRSARGEWRVDASPAARFASEREGLGAMSRPTGRPHRRAARRARAASPAPCNRRGGLRPTRSSERDRDGASAGRASKTADLFLAGIECKSVDARNASDGVFNPGLLGRAHPG
jgi:hypothetical protein